MRPQDWEGSRDFTATAARAGRWQHGFGGNLGGSTGRAARVGEERGHGFFGNLGQHMLGGGGSTEAG